MTASRATCVRYKPRDAPAAYQTLNIERGGRNAQRIKHICSSKSGAEARGNRWKQRHIGSCRDQCRETFTRALWRRRNGHDEQEKQFAMFAETPSDHMFGHYFWQFAHSFVPESQQTTLWYLCTTPKTSQSKRNSNEPRPYLSIPITQFLRHPTRT